MSPQTEVGLVAHLGKSLIYHIKIFTYRNDLSVQIGEDKGKDMSHTAEIHRVEYPRSICSRNWRMFLKAYKAFYISAFAEEALLKASPKSYRPLSGLFIYCT